MVAAVVVITFGLAAGLAPSPISAEPSATPEPTFDLGIAPLAIGGRLEVRGDREGTLVLDEATGIGPRYAPMEDGGVSIRPAEDLMLRGPEGRITFDREAVAVTQIDFEELSFYLDLDDCVVTPGAVNPATDLMAGLVECNDIVDIRGNGTVSIAGVVALPAPVLRGRGDLPPTGGTLDIGGEAMTFPDVEIFLGSEPDPDGRIRWGHFTDNAGLDNAGFAFEYDPDADRFYLIQVSIGEMYAVASEPCPITADELGRIDDTTTVVRFEIECTDLVDAEGEPMPVAGTLVADVIEGFVERGPAAP
jgi:hypothetical protein